MKRSIGFSALATVGIGLSLAACGGSSSSGTSASSYVHQVCTAANSFEQAVSTQSTAFQKDVGSGTNLPQIKNQFVTFLGDAVNDTTTFKNKVDAAGTPSVSQGAQVRQTLDSVLTKLSGDFSTAKQQASALDTSDPSGFSNKVEQIGQEISTAGDSLGSSLDGDKGLGGQALKDAANKDAACQALNKS